MWPECVKAGIRLEERGLGNAGVVSRLFHGKQQLLGGSESTSSDGDQGIRVG